MVILFILFISALFSATQPWANEQGANEPWANEQGANVSVADSATQPWAKEQWANEQGANVSVADSATQPWAKEQWANEPWTNEQGANVSVAEVENFLKNTQQHNRILSKVLQQQRHSTYWPPIAQHLQSMLDQSEANEKELMQEIQKHEPTAETQSSETPPTIDQNTQKASLQEAHMLQTTNPSATKEDQHPTSLNDFSFPPVSWETNLWGILMEVHIPLFLLKAEECKDIPSSSKALCEGAAPLFFPREWQPASLELAAQRLYSGDKMVYVTIPTCPPRAAHRPLQYVLIDLKPHNSTTPHPKGYAGESQELFKMIKQVEAKLETRST